MNSPTQTAFLPFETPQLLPASGRARSTRAFFLSTRPHQHIQRPKATVAEWITSKKERPAPHLAPLLIHEVVRSPHRGVTVNRRVEATVNPKYRQEQLLSPTSIAQKFVARTANILQCHQSQSLALRCRALPQRGRTLGHPVFAPGEASAA